MGGALLGGMGRGFLFGPTLHEGRLLGGGRLPLSILCWELTPECLENGLVKKESPAAGGSDPEQRCPHPLAPDLRSPTGGLMRGRLQRRLGVG